MRPGPCAGCVFLQSFVFSNYQTKRYLTVALFSLKGNVVLDLPVSIGFNPRHNKKPQSSSSIDSNLKKPDMFKQKTLGRRMGFRQSFQGIKLWCGSYFWETCFSVFAHLGNLLYCLLSVHNVKVVFTTIKLEICFWKWEKGFESTIFSYHKKNFILIFYPDPVQSDPSLSYNMVWW